MNPNSEPTAWGGAITALAVAVIPFLRAFGVNITEQQGDAVMTLLAALIVVGTIFLRSRVTPASKAIDAIGTALQTTPTNATAAGSTAQSKEILSGAKA